MDMSLEVVTRDFDQWVKGYVRKYPDEQGKALRNVMLNLLGRIVPRTPVDTGRARGGWYPYADHAGAPVVGGGPGAAQGRSEGSFREDLDGANQFIEVTNGVPYIKRLEYGYSTQAPAGMVRVSMRELLAGEVDDEFEKSIIAADRKAERG
jgi:hypothetical protein